MHRRSELLQLLQEVSTVCKTRNQLSGKLTFHLFAALAEFERDLLRQRGRVGGRPKALTADDLKKARALLRSGEYTKVEVAKELKVSRHTLWRALAQGATL